MRTTNHRAVYDEAISKLRAAGATDADLDRIYPEHRTDFYPRIASTFADVAEAVDDAGGWPQFLEAVAAADVLARDNLARAGYKIGPRPFTRGGFAWSQPDRGGPVFPCNEEGLDIASYGRTEFGHLLPPCQKCETPIERKQAAVELCWTCGFWKEHLDRPDKMIVERADGSRWFYSDRGHRPNARDKSHLGFGGALFRLRPLAGGPDVVSNNVFTAGQIPDVWLEDFPLTHERITE